MYELSMKTDTIHSYSLNEFLDGFALILKNLTKMDSLFIFHMDFQKFFN